MPMKRPNYHLMDALRSKGAMKNGVSENLVNRVRRSPILRKLFVTSEGEVVIGQAPNAPIYVWLVSGGAAFFTSGAPHHWCVLVSETALAVWSILEIVWGANLFRRILGIVVAMLVVIWLARHTG